MAASSSSLPDESWRWNEYIIEEQVGDGRWAKVHKAREVLTNKIIAVKIYGRLLLPAEDRKHVRAIKREVEMLEAAQNGPHIMKVGSVRHLNNTWRTVELPMEFYAGDLLSLISACPKEERGLVKGYISVPPWYHAVLVSMLEALKFLHSEKIGIIHRDVKPENIFFNDVNNFVLGDFGHACRRHPPPHGRSDSLEFMAPEMYDEDEVQTTAVDIWSLGVVCLEMLGCMPKVPNERTFEHMKAGNWCGLLEEIAGVLGKREVETMVQLDASQRPPASDVLTFLAISNSSLLHREKASERLLFLLLSKTQWCQGWPDEVVQSASAKYLSKYEQGPNPASEGDIPEGTPTIDLLPNLTLSQRRPRLKSQGPNMLIPRSTLKPGSMVTRRIMGPGNSTQVSGPPRSSSSSSGLTVSSSSGPSSPPEQLSLARTLPQALSHGTREAPTTTATPQPQQSQGPQGPSRVAPIETATHRSHSTQTPKWSLGAISVQTQTEIQNFKAVETQTPIQHSRTIGTSTETSSQRTVETQTEGLLPQTERSSRTVETQTKRPAQQIERSSSAPAISSRTVSEAIAGSSSTSRGSLIPATTAKQQPQVSPRAEEIRAQQADSSAGIPSSTTPQAPTTTNDGARPSTGSSLVTSSGTTQAGPSSSTSKGSLLPATTAKHQQQGSPRAQEVRAQQAGTSVKIPSTITPPAPSTTNGSTPTSTGSPFVPSSGTTQALQPTQSQSGVGATPSRPLSIDAREYYPLGHLQSEHRQLTDVGGTPPTRQPQARVQQEGAPVRQPVPQPDNRGRWETTQPRQPPSQSSSHPRAQNQAAMAQAGMFPPISPFMVPPLYVGAPPFPVWVQTGLAQSQNPFVPGAPPLPPGDLSGLLDPWNPCYGIGQPYIPPDPTLLGNISSPSFPSPQHRPHGTVGGQPSRQHNPRGGPSQPRPDAARQHFTGPAQSRRQQDEAQGRQPPHQQRGSQLRQVPARGATQARESLNQRPEAQSQQREHPGRNPAAVTSRAQAVEDRPRPPAVPRIQAQQDRPTGRPPISQTQSPQTPRSTTSTRAALPTPSAEAQQPQQSRVQSSSSRQAPSDGAEAQQAQQGRAVAASSRPSPPRNAEAQKSQQGSSSSSSSRSSPPRGPQAQPQAEARRDKTPTRKSPPRRPAQDAPVEEKKEPDPEAGWEQPRHLRRREGRRASKGSGSGSGSGRL